MLAALRTATALKVQTEADGGQRTGFSISLGGFGSAFDRNSALAQ
jgi:invasion protein IalB